MATTQTGQFPGLLSITHRHRQDKKEQLTSLEGERGADPVVMRKRGYPVSPRAPGGTETDRRRRAETHLCEASPSLAVSTARPNDALTPGRTVDEPDSVSLQNHSGMRASQKKSAKAMTRKRSDRAAELTSLGVAEGGDTDAVDLGLDKGSVLRRRRRRASILSSGRFTNRSNGEERTSR